MAPERHGRGIYAESEKCGIAILIPDTMSEFWCDLKPGHHPATPHASWDVVEEMIIDEEDGDPREVYPEFTYMVVWPVPAQEKEKEDL